MIMTKTYTREEALKQSAEYFNGDELAANVFVTKYALRNEKLELIEATPDQMHRRLAKEFARIENKYPNPMGEEEIFRLFDRFKYVCPQGSPMFGIGNHYQKASLSNCFVIDVADSYGGICRADERIAQIAKRRGGVGMNISAIRPKGMPTKNSALTTDGIIAFMDRFSNTTREVAQCIARGQRVLTKNGLKKIEDIEPETDRVWTKTGWVKVIGKIKNQKKTYKMTVKSGYEIRTSIDHVFSMHDGSTLVEKPLSEIEEGDTISLLCGTLDIENQNYVPLHQYEYKNINNKPNNCELPLAINEDLAYIIGYGYGDGYVEKNKYGEPRVLSLACGHKYPEIQTKLETLITRTFKYDAHSRNGDGAVNKLDICNKCVIDFLHINGILKEKSENIIFPEKILNSPNSVILSFLSGYFDADGYASGKKKGYVFSSVNSSFLKVIQTILMSMGILSKLYFEDRSEEGWRTLFSLSIIGKYSKDIFKQKMTESFKVNSFDHCGKRDNWLTPYKKSDLTVRRTQDIPVPDDGQYISASVYSKLVSENNIPIGMLIQDTVVSISEDCEDETYDLQLESEHLFWCEGFYVHNSGRHGALMLSISVHHPEILNFIRSKRDLKKVTGANISVQVTDEFMEAVTKKTTYEQRWPVDSDKPLMKQEVKAKEIWDELVKSNWMSGEPGILFIDSIIKNSPADSYDAMGYRTSGTNPCGELPIPANSKMGVIGSCILLLQNLTSYIKNPFTKDAILDEELLRINTQKSQRLIDDMVDLEIESIDKIIEKVKSDPEDDKIKANELDLWNSVRKTCGESRRTGLGVTGLGDTIAMLNIKYGSKESLKVIEHIFSIIRNESYRSSIKMAKERGAFPIWDTKLEKENLFLNRLPEDIRNDMKKVGRRNIACLTVPPAGSVSTLTQTSSGFEPVFMAEYTRKRKLMESDKDTADFIDQMGDKWKNYKVEHHGLKQFKTITGKEFKDSPYFGAQAEEIDYEVRIKMQGIATSYVDHAISSTINLPKDVDIKTIEKLYLMAHVEGCKGLTIYRDSSRDGVLTKDASTNTRSCDDCDEAGKQLKELIKAGHRPKKILPSAAPARDKVMKCEVHRSKVGKGNWLFFVGLLDNQPYEVFGGNSSKFEIPHNKEAWIVKNGKNKAGITQYNLVMGSLTDENEKFEIKDISKHFNNEKYGATTRLISLNLRHGIPIRYICEQITKTGCAGDFFSFQRAMSRILKKYIADGEISGTECPMCKSTDVYYKNGCPTCKICGNSNCS